MRHRAPRLLTALACVVLAVPGAASADDTSGSVTGRVHDQFGSPIADTKVCAFDAQYRVCAATGPDGAYRLDLAAGTYSLEWSNPGPPINVSSPGPTSVVVGPGQAVNADVVVTRWGSIEVVARDQWGQPTDQFAINAFQDGQPRGWNLPSNMHGVHDRVFGLAAGNYDLVVSQAPAGDDSSEIEIRRVTVAMGQPTRLELTVPRYVPVTGRLVDEKGSAAPGVTVGGDGTPDCNRSTGDPPCAPAPCLHFVDTDSTGHFTLRCSRLAGIVARSATGTYAAHTFDISPPVPPTGVDLGDLAVNTAGTVTAMVRRTDGAPLKEFVAATLYRKQGDDYVWVDDWSFHDLGTRNNRTGAISVTGLQPGTYKAKFYGEGTSRDFTSFGYRFYRSSTSLQRARPFAIRAGETTKLGQIRLPRAISTHMRQRLDGAGPERSLTVRVTTPGRRSANGTVRVWLGDPHTVTTRLLWYPTLEPNFSRRLPRSGSVQWRLPRLAAGTHSIVVVFDSPDYELQFWQDTFRVR